MNINISIKDFYWSYLGYFFNVGVVVILLPFILKFLPAEEVGLWYTFVSISVLVYLVDFGFSNTVIRNISYAWGGATKLAREGFHDFKPTEKINFELVSQIFNATKQIYFIISITALIILFVPGTYYIKSLTENLLNQNLNIAWYIFAFGIVLNLFYSYWTSILKGIGAIKEGQKALVYSKIFQLTITVIGLYLNLGLVAVAIGFLSNGILLRFFSRIFFLKELKKNNQKIHSSNPFVLKVLEIHRILFHNSWRLGVVSLGAYMILQLNTLICSSYFGLETTANYGLTLQLFTLLIAVCSTAYQTLQPEINEACLHNDNIRVIQLISFGSIFNWLVYLIGFIFIILFGPKILEFLNVEVKLLSFELMVFMGIYLFLENNHSMFASYITGQNKIPFMKASIISGIFVVSLSMFSVTYTSLELLGLMIAQSLVQLCYNNWKWPLDIIKKYDLNLIVFYSESVNYIKLKFLNKSN